MNAINELKAMLDERGVKHRDNVYSCNTKWMSLKRGAAYASQCKHDESLLGLSVYTVTPQQAIDGTLGRGECEVYEDEASIAVFGVKMEYRCCECETSFVAWKYDEYDDQIDVKPTFCPNCGRQVKR